MGLSAQLLPVPNHHGDALADADAHRDEGVAPAGALQAAAPRVGADARPRRAQWMTDRDRPAIGVDPAVVERGSSPREQASTWVAKASLISMKSMSFSVQAGAGERLFSPPAPRRSL